MTPEAAELDAKELALLRNEVCELSVKLARTGQDVNRCARAIREWLELWEMDPLTNDQMALIKSAKDELIACSALGDG